MNTTKQKKSALFLALLIATLIILKIPNINRSEFGLYGGDDSRHAMNGVFVMDFIKDKGFLEPFSYVKKYYSKYPALSIQRNPPLFYFLEALFFAIFGVSSWPAEISVMVLFVIGIIFWFKLLERKFGSRVAFLSCFLLITLKSFLFYYNLVMLEVPLLGVICISLYFLNGCLESKSIFFSISLVISIIMLFFTSQKAFIFIPFMVSMFLLKKLELSEKRFKILKVILINFAILALVFVVINILGYLFRKNTILMNGLYLIFATNIENLFSISRMFNSLKFIPIQIGWIFTIFSIVGLLSVIFRRQVNRYYFFIVFIFWVYVFQIFLMTVQKERFVFYGLPILILFTVKGIDYVIEKIRYLNNKKMIVYSMLILFLGYSGLTYRKPFVRGYETCAKFVVQKNRTNNSVLIDIEHSGNFIFFMRKFDIQKFKIIIRAERFLYALDSHNYYRGSFVRNQDEILDRINKGCIKYIVVNEDYNFPERKLLRQLLKDKNKFKVIYRANIDTNLFWYPERILTVYEYLDSKSFGCKKFNLYIPTILKTIEVNF